MRWRPQFSLRMMFVLVTLVGLYFGLWEVTKRWGGRYPDDIIYVDSAQAIGPLMIKTRSVHASIGGMHERTRYELWLFGPRFMIWESNKQIQILPGYYLAPPPETSN